MSQIHQIQFKFLPIEDRLLMKINTSTKEEFNLLLTRRFVSLLQPILSKILHANQSIVIHQNEQIRNELINLQQQEAIQKTDRSTPYLGEGVNHPLGHQPILLAKISTNFKQGNCKLTLEPEKGPGISFNIDQNLTHLLRNLLLESLEKTDWQLDFKASQEIVPTLNQPGKKAFH
ncbi:MAG: hypothetical protein L3J75_08590 [Methylococcaceae bacterium]|nr:hypothetical protein [Methylococcaceae bacterium]